MLFEAGIILGAHSEAVSYPVSSGSSHIHWPYLQLERTVNDALFILTDILSAVVCCVCQLCAVRSLIYHQMCIYRIGEEFT